jgi:hypothetical protein
MTISQHLDGGKNSRRRTPQSGTMPEKPMTDYPFFPSVAAARLRGKPLHRKREQEKSFPSMRVFS